MMKAIVFRTTGEPAAVLQHAEVPEPQLRDGHALVRVTSRPIHPADLAFVRGQYRIRPEFPQTAGLEGAGVVVASADRAVAQIGTRVAFRWPGSWAQQALVPFDRLLPIPDDVSDETGCQISLNPVTAFGLLDEASASKGECILLTAATSVVANLVAAIARRHSIHTIGLVRGNAADARARSGVDELISVADPDLIDRIAAAAGTRRIDGLLDSVGGPILAKLLGVLSPGARAVAYGVQDREPAAITNAMLIYRNLTWKGFGVDHWLTQLSLSKRAAMFDELWQLIRDKHLPLPVAAIYQLDQIGAALTADATAGRVGKVLFVS
jgi:NADPH:quinone reductase